MDKRGSAFPAVTGEQNIAEQVEKPRAPGRGSKRDSMFLMGLLRTLDGSRQDNARIRNISAGGLMAECAWPEGEGSAIVTELKGLGPIIGKVAWNDGKRVGVLFDIPIDPKLARKSVPPAAPAATAPSHALPPYLKAETLPPPTPVHQA